jgi:hypothetical protein
MYHFTDCHCKVIGMYILRHNVINIPGCSDQKEDVDITRGQHGDVTRERCGDITVVSSANIDITGGQHIHISGRQHSDVTGG